MLLIAGCVPAASDDALVVDATIQGDLGVDASPSDGASAPEADATRARDAAPSVDAASPLTPDLSAPPADASQAASDANAMTPDAAPLADAAPALDAAPRPDAAPAPDAAPPVLLESEGPGVDADADGWSVQAGDCDDVRGEVHPDAPERLDALDNDCDGMTDEADEAGGGIHRAVLTERAPPADYPFADRFQLPVGVGDPYTHCGPDDGWYVYTEFREATPCGYARFPGDMIHLGEDWNGEGGGATDVGAAVHAVANGVVVLSGRWGGWGNVLVLRHDAADGTAFQLPDGQRVQTVYSLYGHVDTVAVLDDQPVLRGDVIARIGENCPGCSPHLHWEMIADGGAPFPGPGYFAADARGRVDPTDFVLLNRPVPAQEPPAPSPCAGLPSGDYCGDNGPAGYNGSPDDLITRSRGEISAITPCPAGCSRQPPGRDDLCQTPVGPEVCNGVDDDENGVIDDLAACWMGVKRFFDAETGARCWGEDLIGEAPPPTCRGYVPEQFAFITSRVPRPGAWPVVQCSLGTDHILVEAASADAVELAGAGYDCSVALGHIFREGMAPRTPAVTPNAHSCPLYRFRYDTPGGGAHFFTRGADDVAGMVCEPPARGDVLTEHPCFPDVPAGCRP
jgi:hypothetical protein